MNGNALKIVASISLVLIVSSCDKRSDTDKQVLATVNGSKITTQELEQTLRSMLKHHEADDISVAVRKSILETMVLSRAIQQVAEKQLPAEKKAELELQAEMHRQELYVKAYLQQVAPPKAATMAEIQAYYDQNPSLFGAGEVRDFEMLSGVLNNAEQQREPLLKAFAHVQQVQDWRGQFQLLLRQGLSLRYSQGKSNDKVLHKQLRAALSTLEKGQTSSVIIIDGNPHLLRVTDVTSSEARPLSEVIDDVRRALVPGQLKKALDGVADEVLKQAKITYTKMEQ